MEFTEAEIIERYSKQSKHCTRKIRLTIEYECFSSGNNLSKRKNELTKTQREKRKFINRLKYAEERLYVFILMYIEYIKLTISMKFLGFIKVRYSRKKS